MSIPWTFYPGQLEYLARVGCKDHALIAADVGTGKSLMATALIRLKLERDIGDARTFSGRALIVAPQGTTRADRKDADPDDDAPEVSLSQWRAELVRFAPGVPVYELFSLDDYHALVRRFGVLPSGIYLSYFEAMFRNGAREFLPESWNHAKLCEHLGFDPGPLRRIFKAKSDGGGYAEWEDGFMIEHDLNPLHVTVGDRLFSEWTITEIVHKPEHDYTAGIGTQDPNSKGHGLPCIVAPCLATLIEQDNALRTAHLHNIRPIEAGCTWDLIAMDEAHVACNLDAQLTRSFIRLQPRFRYLFTATPIPNIVTNLFPLMGWLCVPDWHRGGRRNAEWPYALEDLGRFTSTFLCEERDYTQEEINEKRNPRWRGRCVKVSPVLSAPAQLLKLLKRSMAYISKQDCNPNVVPCEVTDVRVPMGEQQGALYEFFADRKNVPGKNIWRKAGVQLTLLRNVCAAPKAFSREIVKTVPRTPACASNFNPKTVAVLGLIRDCLERGEQVVVISSRTEQSDEYFFRLSAAIGEDKIGRIDSTVLAKDHAAEANRFKAGKARVMFMGIKCAKAFSFDRCPNMIVASLEYSFGSLHQAKGRIWRVTSTGSRIVPNDPEAPRACRVWCVLTKGTIEETMYDVVATKQDAATICLLGRRVPRDFKPVDLEEVLAQSLEDSHMQNFRSETDCERKWPEIMAGLKRIARLPAWLARKMREKQSCPAPITVDRA